MEMQSEIYCYTMPSPIGGIVIASQNGQLHEIILGAVQSHRSRGWTPVSRPEADPAIKAAVGFLKSYFAGDSTAWNGGKVPEGTEFFRKVWLRTIKIPFGRTTTYGGLAASVGKPKAARAVGMAMARNRLPILIPCHRVIGSDGGLCGYGGRSPKGLRIKQWLLDHEGVKP